MDIFDILPDEVYGAIDEHSYKFLGENGYYVEGVMTSKKKQKNVLKAMRRKSQTLGIKGNGYEDAVKRGEILLRFELLTDDGAVIAKSKGIKFVIGREVNGRENG